MPKGYIPSNTSVHFINYHFVWCPKYRRKVLNEPIRKRLEELIREKIKKINRDLNASININGREGHSRTYTLVGDCVRPTETKATVDEARTIFRVATIGSPHHL